MKRAGSNNPYNFFILFLALGLSVMFLLLSVAYSYSTFGKHQSFSLPVIFHANTLLILASSYSMQQALYLLKKHEAKSYLRALSVTAVLGFAFLVFQITGWRELYRAGNGLSQSLTGDYLTAISFIHGVHICAGLLPLFYSVVCAWLRSHNRVQQLVFDSDPFPVFRIQILSWYWHFVGGLWLYLYVIFMLGIFVW